MAEWCTLFREDFQEKNGRVSESYQLFFVVVGFIWIAIIELPVLTGSFWRWCGVVIAFYRVFDIFLFSLRWLIVDKQEPPINYRRSLTCFIINLCEIGIYYAIAYLLLGWFEPPMDNWEAMLSSISNVFRLEALAYIKDDIGPKVFELVRILTSWTLIVLIIGNVVGAISRDKKNSSKK